MSIGRVAAPAYDRRAFLGDGQGRVRIPGRDWVYVRLGSLTGTVVRAFLPRAAVSRSAAALDDGYLPASNTGVLVRMSTASSPAAWHVILDSVP